MDWRLLCDGAARGAWNMAVDEALLLSYAESGAGPVLRFYDWHPACLSLGRFQQYLPEWDVAAFRQWGFDVVRRPTGGRAVLHQHEITYSVVIGEELLPPDKRSVLGSYRWLSEAFIEGLRELDIEAALSSGAGPREGAPREAAPPIDVGKRRNGRVANCFSSAALCDFLVGDKKLIGAAQCRKNKVVLQHGSLLLNIDHAAWAATAGGSMADAVSLHSLGIVTNHTRAIEALCAGVERALGVHLERDRLSSSEQQLATQLHQEKYSRSGWTRSGQCER
jgi:lipoate-protein ligase A